MEHTGYHYRLIKFNNNPILSYAEIPDNIKELIKKYCMGKSSGYTEMGPYVDIVDFREDMVSRGGVKMRRTRKTNKTGKTNKIEKTNKKTRKAKK